MQRSSTSRPTGWVRRTSGTSTSGSVQWSSMRRSRTYVVSLLPPSGPFRTSTAIQVCFVSARPSHEVLIRLRNPRRCRVRGSQERPSPHETRTSRVSLALCHFPQTRAPQRVPPSLRSSSRASVADIVFRAAPALLRSRPVKSRSCSSQPRARRSGSSSARSSRTSASAPSSSL